MKRKIIEIYYEGNDNSCTFEFEKCEDTEIANTILKGLLMMLDLYKDDEDDLEIEIE